jgi:hypothetical protein
LVALLALRVDTAGATTLAERVGQFFAPVADAFGKSVGRALPVVAASSGVRFTFDPETGTFERERAAAGGLYIERADPLGRGHWNASVTWERVQFDEFDGQPLRDLSDPVPVVDTDGTPLFALPATSIDVEAHQVLASVTYGLTDAIDLNVAVPIVHTSVDRRDAFVLLFPGARPGVQTASVDDSATGIGDVFLRGKHRFLVRSGFSVASGLVLRLPSGDPDEFHGTGDVEVAPMLYVSTAARRAASWLHLRAHLNAGMNFDASHFDQSEGRWALGVDGAVGSWTTVSLGFVGRSAIDRIAAEGAFDAPRPNGSLPTFGFDGGRPDYVDLSFGGRVFLWRDTLIGVANVLVPLTGQGLSTEPIPLVGIEAAF